jgi:hypothetical protein
METKIRGSYEFWAMGYAALVMSAEQGAVSTIDTDSMNSRHIAQKPRT